MAPKLRDILSVSKRIIQSHPRHYLTLYFIFLLPFSFSSLLFQLLLNHFQQQQQLTALLFLSLFYYSISSFFSFCAISTITYSVYHTFFNQKVKLQEAIKSISTSFFPLLATSTVLFVIIFFISFLFALVLLLVFFVALQRGVDFATNSDFVVVLCIMLLMIVLLAYLQINWSLTQAIVVVESRWGLEPLRRSASLVKGMKRLIVSSLAFFGFFQGIIFGIYYYYISTSLVVILVISPFVAMLMLFQLAVNTVLYIYCKQNHGEVLEEDKLGKEEDSVRLSLIPS